MHGECEGGRGMRGREEVGNVEEVASEEMGERK